MFRAMGYPARYAEGWVVNVGLAWWEVMVSKVDHPAYYSRGFAMLMPGLRCI